MKTRNVPRSIGRLVEIGMETFDQADRLAALHAANVIDRQRRSNYGLSVAELFLEQMGLRLEQPSMPKIYERWVTQTPEEAALMREVSTAVDGYIGAQHRFRELIGHTEAGQELVGEEVWENGEWVLTTDTIQLGITRERPVLVASRYSNDTARLNFDAMLHGVIGMTGSGASADGPLAEYPAAG